MKLKPIFLLFLLLPFLACDDDSENGNGRVTISFEVDGENVEITTSVLAVYSLVSGSSNFYVLTIAGGQEQPGSGAGDGIIITVSSTDPITPDTYNFTGPTQADGVITLYINITSDTEAGFYSSVSGSVVITEFDLENEVMSGTFSGSYTKDDEVPSGANNFPASVSITNGVLRNIPIMQ